MITHGMQESFLVTIGQPKAIVEPDTTANDFNGKTLVLVMVGAGWSVHKTSIAAQTAVVQVR
jgi:hypothetical protein